ncbi:YqhR family membrane protein [Paenibacillus stellifer]|nr:YqhR family membrane protein [Paenibacillus stellifer]
MMGKVAEQHKPMTNPLFFAIETGFFAGLIWGGVRWLFYAIHFTKVVPGFLGEPFFKHKFLLTTAGQLAGYLLFIGFSVLCAILYTLLLRKVKGPWLGMVYGVLWWAILFLTLSWPLLRQPPFRLPWNTVITEFCVFLLWGLFIGYTAANEFTDERKRDASTGMA